MIYGISDLHLDYTEDKSMEIFGANWYNYQNRIFENWREIVKEDDLVLIPGDISWGLKLNDALPDLEKIENLPGKKILLKGNHDYWWKSLNKLNSLDFKTIEFLQNNSFTHENYNIAGTRSWSSRDSSGFTKDDEAIFKRELIRLELSLDTIKNDLETIVILHYPPFNKQGLPNEMGEILNKYDNISTCLYGHLHSDGLASVVEGEIDGITYKCLSADYIDFVPQLIKKV